MTLHIATNDVMTQESINWRALTDDRPDSYETVLIFNADYDEPVFMGYRADEEWFSSFDDHPIIAPTYWAPMPGGPTF